MILYRDYSKRINRERGMLAVGQGQRLGSIVRAQGKELEL